MFEFSIFHWIIVLAIVFCWCSAKGFFPVPAALVVARPHTSHSGHWPHRNFSLAEES